MVLEGKLRPGSTGKKHPEVTGHCLSKEGNLLPGRGPRRALAEELAAPRHPLAPRSATALLYPRTVSSAHALPLILTLLCSGCAATKPRPTHGVNPRDTARATAALVSATTPMVAEALATQLAFQGAVRELSRFTQRARDDLSRLHDGPLGRAGRSDGLFAPHVEYGERQLRWMEAELTAATRLAHTASELEDADMRLALLRLAGPRLEAALTGSFLLATWLDCLHLAQGWLRQGFGSVEVLFVDMGRWRTMLEPAMTALSSLEPEQVEAAAKDAPALVGHLATEFHSATESLRVATKRTEQVILVAQLVEMVTQLSALKLSLPSLPPSAPALLGASLAVRGDGVMMGTRLVVSAEWVEMMRRLVRAGVLSLPAVGAAVRIQAGQVMMAHGELPKGVREALGDGPEVRSMRVTGRAGAGMSEPPRHHVLPKEFREWFERRGFTGEMDINRFCVEMQQAHHEAIHGGGNWKLGRTWPGEWNRMIMKILRDSEDATGQMLTRNEVLDVVAGYMKRYDLPMNFVAWRGR